MKNDQSGNNRGLKVKITGALAVILLAGAIFFFTYYQVKDVQVMGSSHYTEEEVKEMVLKGAFSSNSVLAPVFCTKKDIQNIPFIEGYTVTRLNRKTICVSVREKQAVGCIPYLDSYIYFDRNGTFIEGSKVREKDVPFFDGIQVSHVIQDEKLPIKDDTVLNTAVALATIFQKNETIPDHIQFDNGEISLLYGDITVNLGKDEYLEEKMTRILAILPLISGKKGILHAENVDDNSKTITLEQEQDESTKTTTDWKGGYDESGEYTGDGEYDADGNHVGPKPLTDLENAQEKWAGGYDEEGDYTGAGEYDANGNYVGSAPTEESLDQNGDWKGGYREDGSYDGVGEYDRDGNYVGSSDSQTLDSSDTEEGSTDGDSTDSTDSSGVNSTVESSSGNEDSGTDSSQEDVSSTSDNAQDSSSDTGSYDEEASQDTYDNDGNYEDSSDYSDSYDSSYYDEEEGNW